MSGGTATAVLPAPDLRLRPAAWHRPSVALAVGMAALGAVTAVLVVVDPREITGLAAWAKPTKFALSIALYAATLAWLVGQLPPGSGGRRWADRAATTAVLGLVVEMVIIVGAAAAGTTSHFNVSTPLTAALWSVMGASIAVVWLMTAVVGVALLRTPGTDRARRVALLSAVALGLVGMAVAVLMTMPTPEQQASFTGVVGAHAVGAPDDGPGLPFLGWSTVAGDLRVPHFVGMHALQGLPLGLLALELLARRVPALRDLRVRTRLVVVGALTWGALTGVLTLQALSGQSVVRPAGAVAVVGVAVLVAAVATAACTVLAGSRRPRGATAADAVGDLSEPSAGPA
ncbi:hypothetical protein [Cellulomonas marina]|uniref:Uncharacterized protein n=1 Tax=Cellulomonas marina TaxID=988821 RepID=A0A1I0Z235_9CELL|nr:hypothetical protein [Cellulomonas marina]GIG28193.1 hypothetical protein Cma02nite_07930 [Cellulomonas marina]SFB19704.1 hypothetical protein SAMN05421867_109134 [Cellulomonas marina]